MIERDVKKSLREYLTKLGAYQYWPVPMGFGKKTVDVLFCYQGRFFAVECKRPGVSNATPLQKQVLREVGAASGGWCVENDVALPTVRTMIDNHMTEKEQQLENAAESDYWDRQRS